MTVAHMFYRGISLKNSDMENSMDSLGYLGISPPIMENQMEHDGQGNENWLIGSRFQGLGLCTVDNFNRFG